MEFIIVYSVLEGPFVLVSKPALEYDEETHLYSGETIYIEKWYACIFTLLGLGIALSRMRDKIVFVKIKNIWYQFTCRRHKCVGFVEFDQLVEQSQMNTFLKTSLNTELVITILKGILILAASSSDKIDHMDD